MAQDWVKRPAEPVDGFSSSRQNLWHKTAELSGKGQSWVYNCQNFAHLILTFTLLWTRCPDRRAGSEMLGLLFGIGEGENLFFFFHSSRIFF